MISKNLLLHKSNESTGKESKKSNFLRILEINQRFASNNARWVYSRKAAESQSGKLYGVLTSCPLFLSFGNQQPNSFTGGRLVWSSPQSPVCTELSSLNLFHRSLEKPCSQGLSLFDLSQNSLVGKSPFLRTFVKNNQQQLFNE